MKFKLFLHPSRPKIGINYIQELVNDLDLTWSSKEPDIAIIVGGDGTFGYYARRLMIPMLFVGISDPNPLGSKARLAEIFLENLKGSIKRLQKGQFYIKRIRLLDVSFKKKHWLVFTDIYLERGNFGGCLRYTLTVESKGKRGKKFSDYCIGNGVIISTSIGASGYFSYPQRLASKNAKNYFAFGYDKIGICHINPYFFDRRSSRSNNMPLGMQYTVPMEAAIKIKLERPTTAYLYGLRKGSKGVLIENETPIHVMASNYYSKIIKIA